MRLSRTAVAERDEFVKGLVQKNPTITGTALQTALAEKFGKKMNPGRLYRLRNSTVTDLNAKTVLSAFPEDNGGGAIGWSHDVRFKG